MSSIDVKVNASRVIALVRRLQQTQGFRTGTKTAFVHLKSRIAKYPPHFPRPQAQYWTPQQRRGFFAKLRKGEIDVPWKRGLSPNSEHLVQRWTISGDGYNLKLSNNASYASRVQGREQTEYHKKTGHKRVDTVIKEEGPTMQNIIFSEVKKDLAK